jgi:hypothetical protein
LITPSYFKSFKQKALAIYGAFGLNSSFALLLLQSSSMEFLEAPSDVEEELGKGIHYPLCFLFLLLMFYNL